MIVRCLIYVLLAVSGFCGGGIYQYGVDTKARQDFIEVLSNQANCQDEGAPPPEYKHFKYVQRAFTCGNAFIVIAK